MAEPQREPAAPVRKRTVQRRTSTPTQPPSGRPHPAARARVGAALAGLALAASGAGLAAWDAHTRPPSVAAASTQTTPASGGGGGGLGPTTLFLPDPTLHPGTVNVSFTKVQLCAPDFKTSSVRPPTSYTNRLKALEFGNGGPITAPSGKTYIVTGEHLTGSVQDYELDHLISLEIGGDPEDPANLWMEPWERRGSDHLAPAGRGAESKDIIENRLHREVCAGTMSLADAQHEIATDWTTAK